MVTVLEIPEIAAVGVQGFVGLPAAAASVVLVDSDGPVVVAADFVPGFAAPVVVSAVLVVASAVPVAAFAGGSVPAAVV